MARRRTMRFSELHSAIGEFLAYDPFGEFLFAGFCILVASSVAAIFHFGWEHHPAPTIATLLVLAAFIVEGMAQIVRAHRGEKIRWLSIGGFGTVFTVVFAFWLLGVLGI